MTIRARESRQLAISVKHAPGPRRLRHLLALCAAGMWLASPVVARAQQGWSGTLVDVSERGLSSYRPDVGMDAAGNATVVWKQNFGPIVAAHYARAAGTWSTPAAIPGTGEDDGYPTLVVDAAGNVTVVWVRHSGSSSVVRAARHDAGAGTWHLPTDLSASGEQVWAAAVAVDPAGNAMVVWLAGDVAVVKAARYNAVAGTWSQAVDVAVAGQFASALNVAVDAAGNAIAVWIQHVSAAGVLEAARYNVNDGTWSSAVQAGPASAIADAIVGLAVDAAGTATLVWAASPDVVRSARLSLTSGTIGFHATLASGGGVYRYSPTVGVDGAGNVVAIWVRLGGPQMAIESARYVAAAGTWEPTTRVFEYGSSVGGLHLAVDGAGNATAVWEVFVNRDLVATARYSVATGRWGDLRALSETRGFAFWPRVDATAEGNVMAVWWVEGVHDDYIQSTEWLATPAAPGIASVRPGSGTLTLAIVPPRTLEPAFVPTNYEYSTDDGVNWSTRTPASTASPIRIGGLADGVTYALRIRAANAAGPGAMSDTMTATPVPAPDAPVGLTVLAQTGNTVTVAWTASSGGLPPTGYVLDGGIHPDEVLASIPTGSAAPTFTFVAPVGVFYVRVHAVAGAAWSAPSNEIRIVVGVPAAPSAPTNLLGLVNGSGLALSWTNTFAGGTPTSLWLNVTGAVTTTLPLPLGDIFTYTVVPPGTYTLSVSAANASGVSPPSNAVVLTFPGLCSGMPEAATNLQTWQLGRTIFLSWSPPATGPAVMSYTVSVGGAYVGSFTTTGRTLSGAAAPGRYTLSVAARNVCGAGPSTATQEVVVP